MPELSWFSPVKISDHTLRKTLARAAEKYANGKLIDLGCGTRPYENIFAPHTLSYFGVDFQPTAAVNYGADTKVDLYCDCTATGLPDGSFNTLISTQVMEHIADTHKYLAECKRLLTPGGIAILTVPLVWPCHAEPYDYFRFTPHGLRKVLELNGFIVEEISGSGFSFATACQTFINSLLCGSRPTLWEKIFRRIALLTIVPILNMLALAVDGVQKEGPLCLNYFVAARKAWAQADPGRPQLRPEHPRDPGEETTN